MKTLKSLLIVAAVILATGSTFASKKAPNKSDEIGKSVREKIATVIQSANFQGKGMVSVKFGVNEENQIKILNVESSNKDLSMSVNEVLRAAKINFPKGSKGIYHINVYVNETKEAFTPEMVRQQVVDAVNSLNPIPTGSVKLKFRVVDSTTIKVLKVESKNEALATKVKNAMEGRAVLLPKALKGDYELKISFE